MDFFSFERCAAKTISVQCVPVGQQVLINSVKFKQTQKGRYNTHREKSGNHSLITRNLI